MNTVETNKTCSDIDRSLQKLLKLTTLKRERERDFSCALCAGLFLTESKHHVSAIQLTIREIL